MGRAPHLLAATAAMVAVLACPASGAVRPVSTVRVSDTTLLVHLVGRLERPTWVRFQGCAAGWCGDSVDRRLKAGRVNVGLWVQNRAWRVGWTAARGPSHRLVAVATEYVQLVAGERVWWHLTDNNNNGGG